MEDAKYIEAYNRLKQNISEYQFFYVLALFLVISLLYLLFTYTYSFREFDKSNKLDNIEDEGEALKPELKELTLFSDQETDFDNNVNHYVLADYIIASSYNSCLVQNQRNDYLSVEILKKVLNLGARFLTFQIARETLSEGAEPVVASVDEGIDGEVEGNWITSLNTIRLHIVLDVLHRHGFVYNFKPLNYPLFLFFELKTNDVTTLNKMARHIKDKLSDKLLLNTKYGEGPGKIPLSFEKLINLRNKIIILVDREEFISGTELEDIVIRNDPYLPTHFFTQDEVKNNDLLSVNTNPEFEYIKASYNDSSRSLFNTLFPVHDIDKLKKNDQCRYGECEKEGSNCKITTRTNQNYLTCQQRTIDKKVKISCDKLSNSENYDVNNCNPDTVNPDDFNNYMIKEKSYNTHNNLNQENQYVVQQETFLKKLKSINGIHNYLSNYNKFGFTIVKPFNSETTYSYNSDFYDMMLYGCQFLCMNYQVVDDYLKSYLLMFKEHNTSFLLKPNDLRIKRYIIPDIDLSQVGFVLPTDYYPNNPRYNFNNYSNQIIAIKSNIGSLYLTISDNLKKIYFSRKLSNEFSMNQLFKFKPSNSDVNCFYIHSVIDNKVYLVRKGDIIVPKRINNTLLRDKEAQFYSLNETGSIISEREKDNNTMIFGYKNYEERYSYVLFSNINMNNDYRYGLRVTNKYHNNNQGKINNSSKLKFMIEPVNTFKYIIYIKNNQGEYLFFDINTRKIKFKNYNSTNKNKFVLEEINEPENSDITKLDGRYYLKCYNENTQTFETIHLSTTNRKDLILRPSSNEENSNKIIIEFDKKSPMSAEIKTSTSSIRDHLLFSDRGMARLKDITYIEGQSDNIRNTKARFDIIISLSKFN